ncbi:MAG TPA: YbaB/EbfC family nucleoid-associated protein [Micromonosporaceae bacterium]|nr:YbaB/EbfC family nucleoid-associated protein [Micromonosporaceae bacterium]
MSEYLDLGALVTNPDQILREHQERLAKVEQMQEGILNAVGTAHSGDQRITVSYSEADGVRELRLDPRVMRMPSEELAAEITRLVNEARADVRRQVEQITAESFAEGALNPHDVMERIPEFQQTMDDIMRDTLKASDELNVLLDRMRKMTE